MTEYVKLHAKIEECIIIMDKYNLEYIHGTYKTDSGISWTYHFDVSKKLKDEKT